MKKSVEWDLSPGRNKKEVGHYETKSTSRGFFKNFCRCNKLKFEDFEEVDSREKSGTNKKYYYIWRNK